MQKAEYYLINESMVNQDVTEKCHEILHENVVTTPTGSKIMTITFKQALQDFGVRNWNGRIYDKDVVVNAIKNNPLIQCDIAKSSWFGELGHPFIEKGMNELARQMTIDPKLLAWRLSQPWVEGNVLMAECTTVPGEWGDTLMNRALTGFPPQASSRAIGGVDKQGHVMANYTVITFDAVTRSSHAKAVADMSTIKANTFMIPGSPNTMSESAVPYDFTKDDSFKDFLMSESTSKAQINMLCETFDIDPMSITMDKKFLKMKRMNETGSQTIVIPLNKLVDMEYYNLF